jgi:hypothetical protein
MYLQKKRRPKQFFNLFFNGLLKVNDENNRIRIQAPNPDPLVSSMDQRIRIRQKAKMLWIQNTDDK